MSIHPFFHFPNHLFVRGNNKGKIIPFAPQGLVQFQMVIFMDFNTVITEIFIEKTLFNDIL